MKSLKKIFLSAAVIATVFGSASCASKSASSEDESAKADSIAAAAREQAIADSIAAVQADSIAAAEAANALVLTPEGLPAVKIGMAEKDIPSSVEGIYDSTKSKSVSSDYDMQNPGIAKEITCKQNGKDALFVYVNPKGEVCGIYVSSPEIITTDGIHVGSTVADVKKVSGLKHEYNEMDDTQSFYGNGIVYYINEAGTKVRLIGVGTTL